MKNVRTIRFDLNDDDDQAVFYMRKMGESEIVIIPKETDYDIFRVTETPTTYVVTVTRKLNT